MKTISALALSILVLGFSFGTNQATAEEDLVSIQVSDLFVPVGFDDNDSVEVVVDGYLPDPCHKLDKAVVEFNDSKGIFQLDQKARRVAGHCPDVIVPFTNVVNLGTMNKGRYEVAANAGSLREPLDVELAPTEKPDTYLYAPIDDISLVKEDGNVYAVLEGRFTNSCLSIKEVKVIHTGKTIQLLPIMELSEGEADDDGCEVTEKPFKVKTTLPGVEASRHLLHVRSLNGRSKNLVFNPKTMSVR